jgi:hypothetical protein
MSSPIFSAGFPHNFDYHLEQTTGATVKRLGGRFMIKKSLDEELTIRIDKEKLVQLLGADLGFSVQSAEEDKDEIRRRTPAGITPIPCGEVPQGYKSE